MSAPKVWITRTEPGATQSADVWARAGATSMVAPLLQVTPASTPPRPGQKDILIFTSPNGVRSFAKFWPQKYWRAICVGDATAASARKVGFADIISVGGTGRDVTQYIRAHIDKSEVITHCAGKHVAGTIVEDLLADGFTSRRDLYYFSNPVAHLPHLSEEPDWVALYSPLAAKTLVRLRPDLSTLKIVSISPATDSALGTLQTRCRIWAEAPNEAAMVSAWLRVVDA